jgi:hypothetical protein
MSLLTIEEYREIAGEVIELLDLDADQIEAILENIPTPPEKLKPPTVTKTKLSSLKQIVYETSSFEENVGRAGGWAAIGREIGLWPEQAEKYALMFKALKDCYEIVKMG